MSATSTPQQYESAPSYLSVVAAVFGVVAAGIGVFLLFNIRAAVATLVILTGLSLIISGLGELVVTPVRSAGTWLVASAYVIGGIAALAWPDITLWILALIAGTSLLVAGGARVALSLWERKDVQGWGWSLAGGLITAAAGIAALVWPAATVLVLAVIFGVRAVAVGVASLVMAKELRDMSKAGRGAAT